jgi:uncharacterized protein with HEPN domain
MSKRDVLSTLSQIAEHAHHAQDLCRESTPADLVADWKTSLALQRAMEIIGETVKRLPPELCTAYPAVPWRLIAGMRDRLIHGYEDVDYEILWNAVHQDLPNLLETVERMIRDSSSGGRLV